jgi:DNA-binding response OmpR family regulator
MQSATARILIVEDDRKIASLVGTYLQREGLETSFAYDGAAALCMVRELSPELIVLDLMLPQVDGWQICRTVREFSNVPILMLTARGDEAERVLGFSLGADDYVVKPFSPRELVERVKAVLRRVNRPGLSDNGPAFTFGELHVDPAKYQVSLSGTPISLTPSEYSLLVALVHSPGRVFTRRQLLRRLYPAGEEVVERVVDVHIGKLRQKLEAHSSRKWIETVRGLGYRLAEEAAL